MKKKKGWQLAGWCICSLNDIKKSMTDNFAGWKTLGKAKLMYLEVIMREARFSWCV